MFTNETKKGGTDFAWALVENDPLKPWAFLTFRRTLVPRLRYLLLSRPCKLHRLHLTWASTDIPCQISVILEGENKF